MARHAESSRYFRQIGGVRVLRRYGEGSAHIPQETLPNFFSGDGKLTLRQLATNYKGYFKNSVYQGLQVGEPEVGSRNTLSLNIRHNVKSSVGDHYYRTWVIIERRTLKDKYTVDNKARVKCTCPAFHYFAAYADVTSKNFAGNPSSWNRVAAKIKNPYSIPILCKHITAVTNDIVRRKILE